MYTRTINERGCSNYFPNYSFENHLANAIIPKMALKKMLSVDVFSKPANHLEFALFSTQSIINKNAFRNRSNHSFYFYCGSQLGLLPLAKMILPVGGWSSDRSGCLLPVGLRPVRAGKCRPYLGAPTATSTTQAVTAGAPKQTRARVSWERATSCYSASLKSS